MVKSMKSALAASMKTEEEIEAILRSRRASRSFQQPKAKPYKPLALEMGLEPHPKIRGLYVNPKMPGICYNAQGMATDEPECDRCHDAGFVKHSPPTGRPSAGPWDSELVACGCRRKEQE
jgi:hypothetical protein